MLCTCKRERLNSINNEFVLFVGSYGQEDKAMGQQKDNWVHWWGGADPYRFYLSESDGKEWTSSNTQRCSYGKCQYFFRVLIEEDSS